jgi:hypothetical protein
MDELALPAAAPVVSNVRASQRPSSMNLENAIVMLGLHKSAN